MSVHGPVVIATTIVAVNLAERLPDWTDWDGAAFKLGQALGCFGEGDFAAVKGVFWTDNRLGNGLHQALIALVEAGLLDRREEPDEQFRWRADALVATDASGTVDS